MSTAKWQNISGSKKIFTSFVTTFIAFPCTFGSFRFWILAHFDLTRFSKFFLKTRILVLVCFDFLFPFCATYIKVFTKPFQSTCVGFSSQFTSQCLSQNWLCKSVWMSSSDFIDWKCVIIKRTFIKFEYSKLKNYSKYLFDSNKDSCFIKVKTETVKQCFVWNLWNHRKKELHQSALNFVLTVSRFMYITCIYIWFLSILWFNAAKKLKDGPFRLRFVSIQDWIDWISNFDED